MKIVDQRIERCKEWLEHLLSRPKLTFDEPLDLLLPKEGGIYHIAERGSEGCSLYVGETDNLQDCILRSHLNGNSSLKKKLMKDRKFRSWKRARQYLRERCFVQYVLVDDKRFRTIFKYFTISALNPEFND
jgi:hypothetical protein